MGEGLALSGGLRVLGSTKSINSFPSKLSESRRENTKIGGFFESLMIVGFNLRGSSAEVHKVWSGGELRHKGYDLDVYRGNRHKCIEVKGYGSDSYVRRKDLFKKVIAKFAGVPYSERELVIFGGYLTPACYAVLRRYGVRVTRVRDLDERTLKLLFESIFLADCLPFSDCLLFRGDGCEMSLLSRVESGVSRDLELVVLACLFDRVSLKYHGHSGGAEVARGFSVAGISNKVCRILLGPSVVWSDRSRVIMGDFIVSVASRYNSVFIKRSEYLTGAGDNRGVFFEWVGGKENKRKLSKLIKKDIQRVREDIREFKRVKALGGQGLEVL